MKILAILIPLVVMGAQHIYIVEGKNGFLTKKFIRFDANTARGISSLSVRQECYYQNGIVSPRSCYRQTGNIFVSFKNAPLLDIEKFANTHQLKKLSTVNPLYQTILFRVQNGKDPIEIVNKINKKYQNIDAHVEWIRPRFLR